MFNYKRLTFVFLFLTIFLLATDTSMEKQIRRSLLSFFDIVVEESGQVSGTAPSSFLDTLEEARIGSYNFLNKQNQALTEKISATSGPITLAFTIANYLILFFKFIANYVITFYPALIFLIYIFLTSRFFKKDEFGYDNY